MKTNRSTRSSQTGGILVLVMTMLVAFSLLTAALLQLGRYSAQEAELQFNKAQAFWLAEMGLERVKAEINTTNGWAKIKNSVLNSTWTTNFNVPNAGSYSVKMTGTNKNFVITSIGRSARNGAVQTNQIDASLKGFGDRLWSTGSENQLYFGKGDDFYGLFRTDDNIWIKPDKYPKFYDLVQVSGDVLSPKGKKKKHNKPLDFDKIFLDGLETGVPEMDWTGVQADFIALSSASGVKTPDAGAGPYDVIFDNNTVQLQKLKVDDKGNVKIDAKKGTREPADHVNPQNINIGTSYDTLFYINGDVYAEGTVGGRVGVATTNSIYIMDNIKYQTIESENDPTKWASKMANKTEALGLYAGNKVQIRKKDGVSINAAIVVLNPTIPVRDRHKKGKKLFDQLNDVGFCVANAKDTEGKDVNLYGSIAQLVRGAVSKEEIEGKDKKGDKNYIYDSRFSADPPPGMPSGNVFVFSNWKQL